MHDSFSLCLYSFTYSALVIHFKNSFLCCFSQDNNSGLLKQVIASLYKQNIQRLTKVVLWNNFLLFLALRFLGNNDNPILH